MSGKENFDDVNEEYESSDECGLEEEETVTDGNKTETIIKHIPYSDETKICKRCKVEHSHTNFKRIGRNKLTEHCVFCLRYIKHYRKLYTYSIHDVNALMAVCVHRIGRHREYQHSYEVEGDDKGVELKENEVLADRIQYHFFEPRLKELEDIINKKQQLLSTTKKCTRCSHVYNMTEFKEKTFNGVLTGKYSNVCDKCRVQRKTLYKSIKSKKGEPEQDITFKSFFDDTVVFFADEDGDNGADGGRTYATGDLEYKISKINYVLNDYIPKKLIKLGDDKIKIQELNDNKDKLIALRDSLQQTTQVSSDTIKCSKCKHDLPVNDFTQRKNGTYTKMCKKCREMTKKK